MLTLDIDRTLDLKSSLHSDSTWRFDGVLHENQTQALQAEVYMIQFNPLIPSSLSGNLLGSEACSSALSCR